MRLGVAGVALAGIMASAPTAQSGLTIEDRRTFPGGSITTTTYVQDDRSREEWRHERGAATAGDPGDVVAHIIRCDLQKALVLSYGERSYMSSGLGMATTRAFRRSVPASAHPPREDDPHLVIETETVRTGERREAFGYLARRVITIERRIPLVAAAGEPRETVTDGWYIHLETRPSCERLDPANVRARLVAVASLAGEAPTLPRVAYREIGVPERGYAIEARMTSRSEGTSELLMHAVVTSLVHGPLDPALFEIPPGFRHAGGPLAAFAERLSGAWAWMRLLFADWFR
jgi:hypothetical protein